MLDKLEELLAKHKVKKEFKAELLDLVTNYIQSNKTSRAIKPPTEIAGEIHYYCRFHQEYYPENLMVMSKGKSKGYCKAAISHWNRINASIKKLEAQASHMILSNDIDKAREIAAEVELLKTKLNDPTYYNAEEDWANFRGRILED